MVSSFLGGIMIADISEEYLQVYLQISRQIYLQMHLQIHLQICEIYLLSNSSVGEEFVSAWNVANGMAGGWLRCTTFKRPQGH